MPLKTGSWTKSMLTVVVPVYNEEKTIRSSIERVLKAEFPLPVEVLVVDDGSVDSSMAQISDLIEQDRVKLVRHKRNRGKGAAVRSGIEAASGDILTIFDADLEYDPDDYKDLLMPLLNGEAEVVYGTRSFGAHTAYSFWFVMGNHFLSFLASFLFNTWISDIETCFKLARTDVWRSLRLKSNGFGIEAECTAKFLRAKHRIYEIPIKYRARTRAEGKKLQWTDGLTAIWILVKIRLLRPLTASAAAPRSTRGSGRLEAFLAKKRAAMADKLLEDAQRTGSILDLGCGTTPYLLINTQFSEKLGVDKRPMHVPEGAGVRTVVHDIEKEQALPFEDGSFDVVTMLAVLEHLAPKQLIRLLDEIHRVLRPEGTVILTTPASWTDPILAAMSRLGMVSHEEIDEHHQTYTHGSLRELFSRSRFGVAHLQLGSFELGMNLWAKARKR